MRTRKEKGDLPASAMAAKSQRQNGSEDESELKTERGTAAKTEKGLTSYQFSSFFWFNTINPEFTPDLTKCTSKLDSNSGPSLHVLFLFTTRSPSSIPNRWRPKAFPPRRAQSYLHSPHLCLCRLLYLLPLSEFKSTPRLEPCTPIVRQAETRRSKATQAQVMGRLA